MSNRMLRKLCGNKDIDITNPETNTNNASGGASESESDDISNHNKNTSKTSTGGGKVGSTSRGKKLVNRFELLNSLSLDLNNSLSDTEAKEDDDKDNESAAYSKAYVAGDRYHTERNKLEKQDSTQSTDSLKRKKKRKKKLRSQKSLEGQLSSPQDDIEATVQEVNRILGSEATKHPVKSHKSDEKTKTSESSSQRRLLYIEHRHLNSENEMKRIFGSKVIQAEVGSRIKRGRGRAGVGRSWILVNPRNYQNITKSGLKMEHLNTVGDVHYLTLVHNKMYQSAQFQFLDAVESYNPDNLVAILNVYPNHIDTLIQFSDVCKIGEDHQMAAELIERALHCIEHTFHPLFNVTQGNCRLDYRRPENRSFYISLFKHLGFVGQRGCNRTALEFCKLLLGFDPEGDPLCVLLMIDFYAIRSEQFDYLITFYREWSPSKQVLLLPNFRFSVPLAMYLKSLSTQDESEKLLKEADSLLQEALILFPEFLMPLLDKCSVEPDSQVAKCSYFNNILPVPQAVTHLIALHVGRNHLLWKDRGVMTWLEGNVRAVIKRIEAKDPLIATFADQRKKFFNQGTPRNVLRHIILSGIKEATVSLPPDLTKSAIFGFDPLPPLDSIISYSRPESSLRSHIPDQGLLSVFLRSWLPDFNLEDRGRARGAAGGEGQVAQAAQPAEEGAEGGAPRRDLTNTNDLRRSVTSLLDAMRDLLGNINMADVPNEGDVESEDDDDVVEEHHHEHAQTICGEITCTN